MDTLTTNRPLTGAERQQRHRAKHAARTITITLTEEELATLAECYERQRPDVDQKSFYSAALIQGAKFRANSGNTDRR